MTIIDAMTLVGATALDIVTAPPVHYLVQLRKELGAIDPGRLLEPAYLFLGSVTFLVLRVIPPRPPLRALLRQPGLWGCGTLTSAVRSDGTNAIASRAPASVGAGAGQEGGGPHRRRRETSGCY